MSERALECGTQPVDLGSEVLLTVGQWPALRFIDGAMMPEPG